MTRARYPVRARLAATVLLIGMAGTLDGCGDHRVPGLPHDPLPDPVLDTAIDAGRSAFDLGRYDQAADQYESAYRRALLRDDAPAMIDATFDLAAARMRQDKPSDALTVLDRAGGDLALRGAAWPASLRIARAAALLQTGDAARARASAAPARDASDPQIAERAAFLHGVASARLCDTAMLSGDLARIPDGKGASALDLADHLELEAHLALINGHASAARDLAARTAVARQALLDYRGMHDALAIEAAAARAMGRMDDARSLQRQITQSRLAGRADAPIATGDQAATPRTKRRGG